MGQLPREKQQNRKFSTGCYSIMADEDTKMMDELKKLADEKQKENEDKDKKETDEDPKKDDDDADSIVLFDGGIKKKIIREGTGATPPAGSKVKVHYTGTLESDGSKFDSSRDRNEPFEFTIGEGSVIKAWDEGVATMKVGERAILTCIEDFAYGKKGSPPKIPGGATLIFDIDLLSFGDNEKDITDGDRGVLKIVTRKGEGYQNPSDSGVCKVKYTGSSNDKVFTTHNADEEVTLNIDEDLTMPEGLNKALQSMNKGEKATFKVRSDYGYGAEGNKDLGIPPNTDLVYNIDLLSFENEKSSWDMDVKEKLASMVKKKKKGNTLFGMRKYSKACDFYSKALGVFLESDLKKDDLAEEDKKEIKKNQVSCHSNTALCKLKSKDFAECIESCNKALELDADNVKAIFRRGQAHAYNGSNVNALSDLKAAQKLNPDDKQIAKMVLVIKKRVKKQKQAEKDLYKGMFNKVTLARGKTAGYPEAEGDSSSSSSSSSDDSSSDDEDEDDDDKKEDKKEDKDDPKVTETEPKKEEKTEAKEEPKKEEKTEVKEEKTEVKEEKTEVKEDEDDDDKKEDKKEDKPLKKKVVK